MKKFLATMLALVMALTLCATAWAEGETSVTLNVNGSVETSATERAEGATFKTVQEAIDRAQAGDTIQIAAGTYAAFHVDKALTFIGSGESTVIETMEEANDVTSCSDCNTDGINYIAKSIIIHLSGGSVAIKNMTITSAGKVENCKWYEAAISNSAQATGNCPDSITVENCSIRYTGAEGGNNGMAICATVANLAVKDCVISGFETGINLLNDGIAFGTLSITGNTITANEAAVSAYSGQAATEGSGIVTVTGNTFTGTGVEPAQVSLLDYAKEQNGGSMFGNLNIGSNTHENAETIVSASTGSRDNKIINPTVENGKVTSGIFNFNPVGEGVTLGGVELHNDPILASSTNSDNETSYYFGAQNIATAATDNGNITVVRGGNEVITVPAGTTVSIANNVEKVQVNGNDMTSGSTTTFYTVTFKNGDNVMETKTVASGSTVTAPAAPTNGSKIFDGWYVVNADGTKKAWDFTKDTVTNNMTLTAQWHTRVRINSTTTTTPTTETKAESPKTFDAGIAVYGVMALTSVLGMGYIGKKKF